MTAAVERPYGSWPSPLRPEDLVSDAVRLAEPWLDGEDIYWLESRPSEEGRRVLVRHSPGGTTAELTPPPFNVRTRVHEYGGGSYTVAGGTVVFSDVRDGRLYRLDPGVALPIPITPDGPWRYADLRFDAGRRRFIAVREDHAAAGYPEATIVAVPLDGDSPPTVLVQGPDFLAAPRVSPDGSRLAWLEWDHPDMPWDATRLRVGRLDEAGAVGRADLAAGGPEESIAQPEWSPGGILHFVSDRSGWWNLYRLMDGPRLEPLCAMDAEFADPAWVLGLSAYGFLADGSIAAVGRRDGTDRLFRVVPGQRPTLIPLAYTELDGLVAGLAGVVAVAASPTEDAAVVTFDAATLAPTLVLRRERSVSLDPRYISVPESMAYGSTDGRVAHARYYPPHNPHYIGPEGELPPLVVYVHGGPTSGTSSGLDLDIQLLTSRGIAVVDVDYGGSTGYGRTYRETLDGAWGVVDVDDSVAAARFLVARGDVDPDRLAIAGASAGGYTTLAALAFRDTFSAGVSQFGIGDLAAMAVDTHKFESRYLDRLIGPYPAAAETYRQRSPIHHLDGISCPVLVLQGLDDKVVPPNQAEAIVEALAARGIPHAYLAFEGEAHGFRGGSAIRRAAEAELAFLGAVFGFSPAGSLPELALPGLDAWQKNARRRSSVGVQA